MTKEQPIFDENQKQIHNSATPLALWKKNRKKGFTLVELIVCIVIILILAGAAVPFVMKYIENAQEAADVSNIRTQYMTMMSDVLSNDYEAGADRTNNYRVDLGQNTDDWQSYKDGNNVLKNLFNDVRGIPRKGGYATMHYTPNGELYLLFHSGLSNMPAGGYPNHSETMKKAIFTIFTAGTNAMTMTSWDSTYTTTTVGITEMQNWLNQTEGTGEIKSWAIINKNGRKNGDQFGSNYTKYKDNPELLNGAEKDLYYLWTGVDIQTNKDAMRGKKVPVMVAYTNESGQKEYSVADITVTQGDSGSYNVISGRNPRPKETNYNIDTHLNQNGTRTIHSSYDEAYADYKERLDRYNAGVQ